MSCITSASEQTEGSAGDPSMSKDSGELILHRIVAIFLLCVLERTLLRLLVFLVVESYVMLEISSEHLLVFSEFFLVFRKLLQTRTKHLFLVIVPGICALP